MDSKDPESKVLPEVVGEGMPNSSELELPEKKPKVSVQSVVALVAPVRQGHFVNSKPNPSGNQGQVSMNSLATRLAPQKAEVHRCPNCYGIVLNSQQSRIEVLRNLSRLRELKDNVMKRCGNGQQDKKDAKIPKTGENGNNNSPGLG